MVYDSMKFDEIPPSIFEDMVRTRKQRKYVSRVITL